jgi:hypothetical protein
VRYAKGVLQLSLRPGHIVEVRPRADGAGVRLEIHRDDCRHAGPLGGPVVTLQLDEAQALLRTLQGACDEAYRRAKAQHKAGAA